MSDLTRRQVLSDTAGTASALALGAAARAFAAEPRSPHPSELSLVELLPLLATRRLSARELVEDCLCLTDVLEPSLKTYITQTPDLARQATSAADEARAAEKKVGLLAGIPIGLKDLYYTKSIRTTAGSRVLADFVPGTDASVWQRLRGAGAGLAGKTNTHEFAYGTSFPPTRNLWDTNRNPGGSSGGPGAALAARLVPVELGRTPAGLCASRPR